MEEPGALRARRLPISNGADGPAAGPGCGQRPERHDDSRPAHQQELESARRYALERIRRVVVREQCHRYASAIVPVAGHRGAVRPTVLRSQRPTANHWNHRDLSLLISAAGSHFPAFSCQTAMRFGDPCARTPLSVKTSSVAASMAVRENTNASLPF